MLDTNDQNLPDVNENTDDVKSVNSDNQESKDLEATQNTPEESIAEATEVTPEGDDKVAVTDDSPVAEDTPEQTEIKENPSDSDQTAEPTDEKVVSDSKDSNEEPEVPAITLGDDADVEDVVKYLGHVIATYPIQKIGQQVEQLKRMFNVKFGQLLKEARKKHADEGGEPSDFHYENPIQQVYNDVLFEYKTKRQAYQDKITAERQENLVKKQAIIEELKALIDSETPDNIYNNFKALQDKWRSIGAVPHEAYKDLWQTYHFHVERFYDLLHLSNELRDLDFKHNLEEKTKLVLKAEALAESEDIKSAFSELQILHRIWKEDVGPVAREYREEIWNRFSEATKKIHDKRHSYYDSLKETYEQNLLKKEAVLQELEHYNQVEHKSHNDWQKSIKQVEALRKQFIKSGRVPKHKDREIWEKFRSVNKVFNQAKNQYYKGIKKDQQANLEKKRALIEIAESYKDSEDWNEAVEVMKKIQQDWKTIGHVPRRVSDTIWNEFKGACNHFFDRYRAAMNSLEESRMGVYIQKKKYLNDLKKQAEADDFTPDLETLMSYVDAWKDFGVVPEKQRYIDVKFNKFLDPYFDKVSEDKSKLLMLRYKTHIDQLVEQKDTRRINDEIQFVRKKIDHIGKEKQQMETNSQFFSNADESNPMLKNIRKEIEKLSFELSIWEDKLKYLRSIEF